MSKPKIYLFLQAIVADIETWVSVAESGFCLASHSVPLGLGELARMKLGEETKWRQNYEQHYPDGYELVTIEDINAPEYVFLLNRIRKTTEEKAAERKQQYALARKLRAGMNIRTASAEEVEQLKAAEAARN